MDSLPWLVIPGKQMPHNQFSQVQSAGCELSYHIWRSQQLLLLHNPSADAKLAPQCAAE
jgi:hypothetical protein